MREDAFLIDCSGVGGGGPREWTAYCQERFPAHERVIQERMSRPTAGSFVLLLVAILATGWALRKPHGL